jgi:hypothetical protein
VKRILLVMIAGMALIACGPDESASDQEQAVSEDGSAAATVCYAPGVSDGSCTRWGGGSYQTSWCNNTWRYWNCVQKKNSQGQKWDECDPQVHEYCGYPYGRLCVRNCGK